jgi:sporulation protein YhbH
MGNSFKDIWDLKKSGKRDSTRHKERIRKAIKDNLRDLIAEENIITSSGKHKIKVPVQYLDMWRFKFGNNKKNGIGFGDGDLGQIIHSDKKDSQGSRPGDAPGDDVYEEVDRQEVIEMMLEDLGLPWFEDKEDQAEIVVERIVFQDISNKGIPPNRDRRRSMIKNLKRNSIKGKPRIGDFQPDDLQYRQYDSVVERHSNASVTLIMDRSGSMDREKRYIVKSFFFWMVNFLRLKYSNVSLVFIAFDYEAKEVPEENFFSISDGGGTRVSSGLSLAKEIVEERFPKDKWNNYVFAFSDGDNYSADNLKCIEIVKELLNSCRAVGYGEVDYDEDEFYRWTGWGGLWSKLHESFEEDEELMNDKHFMMASIVKRDDIYDCLRRFLEVKKGLK